MKFSFVFRASKNDDFTFSRVVPLLRRYKITVTQIVVHRGETLEIFSRDSSLSRRENCRVSVGFLMSVITLTKYNKLQGLNHCQTP